MQLLPAVHLVTVQQVYVCQGIALWCKAVMISKINPVLSEQSCQYSLKTVPS